MLNLKIISKYLIFGIAIVEGWQRLFNVIIRKV